MFRPASLMNVALVAILAAAPLANAGGHKHFKPPIITIPDFKVPGHCNKPPIVIPPITLPKPPIVCPPRPPIIRPNPPIVCPPTPPIVCPPRPPVICPPKPPVICPPPVVCPPQPPVICPPPVVCPPKPPVICPPPVIKPICYKPVCPPVCTCHDWYFGMSLQLTDSHYGRGLQVTSVTPGSPAHHAGLEPGDILYAANQASLQTAVSNEHGVQLLQSQVVENQVPSYGHVALTSVWDASTNQVVRLDVTPTREVEETPVPTTLTAMAL